MSWLKFWQRQRALASAPFSETRMHEKSMRIAAYRARKGKQTAQTFAHQQAFDRAVAELVRAIRRAEGGGPNGS